MLPADWTYPTCALLLLLLLLLLHQFVTSLANEVMTSRVINNEGAMGGRIVPVLKIEWAQQAEQASKRGLLLQLQKLLMLGVIPLWHYITIALVDVSLFVENETYAGESDTNGFNYSFPSSARLCNCLCLCARSLPPHCHPTSARRKPGRLHSRLGVCRGDTARSGHSGSSDARAGADSQLAAAHSAAV